MKREIIGFAAGFAIVFGAIQIANGLPPAAGKSDPVSGLVRLISPAAMADEPVTSTPPTKAVETNGFPDLVKIDGESYRIETEPGFDSEAIFAQTVRKIGYGRVSEIRTVTTGSGAYSTDGLASPNVLYPGISATPVVDRPVNRIVALLSGGLWVGLPMDGAGSFVHYGRMQGGGRYITSNGKTCVAGPGFAGCS